LGEASLLRRRRDAVKVAALARGSKITDCEKDKILSLKNNMNRKRTIDEPINIDPSLISIVSN